LQKQKECVVSDEQIPLTTLGPGQVAVVRQLAGGRGFVGRLASLGFAPGVAVRMLQNFGRGPLIVLVRDTRVALGRGEAMKIWVSQKGGSDD
jgi:ferrous iron transport protein A